MDNNAKPKFNKKRAAVLGGVVILLVSAGIVLISDRFQRYGSNTGDANSIPIESNLAQVTPESAEKYAIDIQLQDGIPQFQSVQILPRSTGERLLPEQIESILSRLPALPLNAGTEFNFPSEILPPPRPGNTIEETFPPLEIESTPGAVEAGPLKVLRYAPEGEVPIAPFVSVTFNQPMIPLGTISDLAAQDVPLKIEPALPGTWRWLGTQTLTFEADSELFDRLPKATEYRLTVPAGTKSLSGQILSEPVSWTFTTPPPKIVTTYPNGTPQPLDPIIFVAFDQRIDALAVWPKISVMAGNQKVDIVLANETEIENDEQVGALVKDAQEGRWLAFRATKSLPPETDIHVTVDSGTPSAEGPLTTTQVQTFSFSTYAPLRIEDHSCSWYDESCPPLSEFFIRFNNPLNVSLYKDEMLRVEPEIPGVAANVYGNSIEISGETKGQTTYTVIVSSEIQDVFGQKLGDDVRLTFKVGKAGSVLVNPEQTFLTLDPAVSDARFSFYAINYSRVNVKIYAVQPTDWPKYLQALRDWREQDRLPEMPGLRVESKTLSLKLPVDTLSQIDLDLNEYMEGKYGHFIVVIEPPTGILESDEDKWRRYSQTIITWAQITQIGLDAFNDHTEMVAWATDLKNGAPLSGVSIQPGSGGSSVLTGPDGVARFAIPSGAAYLVARRGDDQAILPRSTYYWYEDTWSASTPGDSLRWYVFDDRQMYRPGEDVHVKGWLRKIGAKQTGTVELLHGLSSVTYQINDSQGNSIGSGEAQVNALGGFDFAFTIPQVVNLGDAQIMFSAQGSSPFVDGTTNYYHPFSIQEFRRPEFEVAARNETAGPYFAGDHATLAVDAKYYAGGGLPNADVTWQVTTSPGSYSPPNWPDFTFGNWNPWWFFDFEFPGTTAGETETFSSKTDASGTHYLELDFDQTGDPAKDPQPHSILAQSTVMDVNLQAWSSTTTLLVHPSDPYIGIRSDRYFVGRDTPLKIEFIVTDLDGNPIKDRPVEITAGRLDWKTKNGSWVEEVVDVQTCTLLSQPEPGACSFETPRGGSYQITAQVIDELGRRNQSRFTRWVSGGEQPPARNVEQEKLTLIPDKENYQPGDTAQILVQSPFTPAEGLLTVSRSGILYTTRFEIEDGSAILKIPIEEEHIPNLNIQVDLVGSAPRSDDRGEPLANVPPRPAYASGQLNLSIPPLQRTLSVEAAPLQDKLEPGGETTLRVVVKDANGLPVSDAELAVVVVDEAILALTNYQIQDPLSVFYPNRPSDLMSIYGRASIILADPKSIAAEARASVSMEGMGGASPTMTAAATEAPAMEESGADETQQEPINLRSDFNPLATFAPTVRTRSNGEARVFIKLPDNLTRYRVMVVAVDQNGNQFGTGESNITARLPLMVRPSAPRFLNFGDSFQLPVILQNQTDEPMTVDIAARATNLQFENAGLRVNVPANDRVEVLFPASTVMAGNVQIQIAATSGSYADAATVELPVYTPATSEAFATYGVIDDGAVSQSVLYPSNVFPQFGGLEVSTSSTALHALTDAVSYLVTYRYEASEPMASRILAVASLQDVLTEFKAEGLPTAAQMEAAVDRDMKRLQGMQNNDGGFPYWRRGNESIPFHTIHVAYAMFIAQQKGYDVPAAMQQNVLIYLQEIENYYQDWYTQETRWTLSAYALHVRNLMGDRDAGKAEALLQEAGLERLPLEAIGWLWPVIDNEDQLDAIRLFVNNHVVETAGAANFTTEYSDQTYLLLSSDRRTDAILLDALIGDNPQSDLIPKVVNGLLAHRTKGRWDNTQENVFVLIALDRYFNTYESQTPDFVARIWLGDTYAGGNEFRGRTTDISETTIPMNYVLSETSAGGGTQDLILSKDGPGRLYYRLGLQYAPTDLELDPLNMGFVVQRLYEAVDNPEDVYQDKDGVWHIKAGARVRVKLTIVANNRRYHVALVDPLPAGLEIINPELTVSESIPQNPASPDYRYIWWGPWYEHQNMRDDRAEAFTSLLWDGVYEYSYVARATTPGTFVVPPARAEEMYSPEVFGRTGSDWVIVE